MSSYNGGKYIQEQIESIINQKGEFILDLVVRDDGSSDETLTILEKYEAEGRLRYIKGSNVGPAKSFMELVRENKGYDYYSFSDQDDVWKLDKIDRALRGIEKTERPVVYFSNAKLVDRNLNSLGRDVYKECPRLDFYTMTCAGGILGCSIVFNSKVAQLIQEKDLPQNIIMHDFYIVVLCKAVGGEIIYDRLSSLMYRQHDRNVIGVFHGFRGAFLSRINDIMKKNNIGIAEQADEILSRYDIYIDDDKKIWLKKVSNYRKHFFNRVLLAFSTKTKYINLNYSQNNS